jgi:hypothetical protein
MKMKKRPVETVPGMGGGWIKDYTTTTHRKNFATCHNVLPSATIIKKRLKNKYMFLKSLLTSALSAASFNWCF